MDITTEHELKDCGTVVDYYKQLEGTDSIYGLNQRILKIIEGLGFSDYSVVWLCSIADEKARQLCSFPTELIKAYYDKKYYEHDILLEQTKVIFSPSNSSEIQNYLGSAPFITEWTEVMNDINHLNRAFGFYNHFTLPIKSQDNAGNAILTVAIRGALPDALNKQFSEVWRELRALCEAIDVVATRDYPAEFLCEVLPEFNVSINEKPLRVMATLANNDFTIGQVADSLCISVVTANKHLENCRKALGVRTNYAAIKIALANGLIEYKK